MIEIQYHSMVVLQSAVALEEGPDWISQLLINCIFDILPQDNEFLLARNTLGQVEVI